MVGSFIKYMNDSQQLCCTFSCVKYYIMLEQPHDFQATAMVQKDQGPEPLVFKTSTTATPKLCIYLPTKHSSD